MREFYTCAQKMDYLGKKLTDLSSLEFPERRWGSTAADFIVKKLKTISIFDGIPTFVNRLTKRFHFCFLQRNLTQLQTLPTGFSVIFSNTPKVLTPLFRIEFQIVIQIFGSYWWNYIESSLKYLPESFHKLIDLPK